MELEIVFALRDEKINIFSMTYGGLPLKNSHQFLLCKKTPFPDERAGPFLLDMKKSEPIYKLSKQGVKYFQSVREKKYDLSYVGFVDFQVKVIICFDLFEKLSELGFFSIWDSEAPMKYFEKENEGFLVVFKVYLLEDVIAEELLEKGRRGGTFISA